MIQGNFNIKKYAQDYLDKTKNQDKINKEVVKHSEIIFVPIQTPHGEQYEGITRIPDTREDFDYTFLKKGVKDLSDEIERQGEDKIVIVISTTFAPFVKKSNLCWENTLSCVTIHLYPWVRQ